MTEPILKLKFLSHGTIDVLDLDRSRKFYTEFLGLQTVRTSPNSMLLRLGGKNTIVAVQVRKKSPMSMLNHNGIDVETREEVDRCHRITVEQQERWGIKKITKPSDQHGNYAFYFTDLDDNWWEILTNPDGGYSWLYDQETDLQDHGLSLRKPD